MSTAAPDLLNRVEGESSSTVRVGDDVWEFQTLNHCVTHGYRWVHVTLLGRTNYSVVLRMTLTARPADALRALEWWLCQPGREDGDIVEVD